MSVERDELVRVGGQVGDGDSALLPDKLGHTLQLHSAQTKTENNPKYR